MEQFFEFAGHHWALSLALVAVIVAIIVNEILILLHQDRMLEPEQATHMYNRNDAVFIDLRGENAYLTAHLPGAVNLPMPQLEQQLERIRQYGERPVILYDDSETQARKARSKLKKLGLDNIYQLKGGIGAWQGAGLPTKQK